MTRRLITRLAAIAAVVICGLGCVSYCDRVGEFEARFRERSTPGDEPHLRMAVPYAMVDGLLAERVREIDPVRLSLGDLGGFLAALIDLRVNVASVNLRHANADRIGFAVALDIKCGDERWLTIHVDAQVEPRIEGRAVSIGLRAEDLQSVEPRLGPEASAKVAEALAQALPRAVVERLDQKRLADAASALLAFITGEGYRQIRRALFPKLGDVARVRVALPEIPLRLVRTYSREEPVPHLVIDGFTDRPVRRGVSDPLAPSIDAVRVRLSGSTVAEMGNWALEKGFLPARYDGDMQPSPDGKVRPLFDWRSDNSRPLVLHVLGESPCFLMRIGA